MSDAKPPFNVAIGHDEFNRVVFDFNRPARYWALSRKAALDTAEIMIGTAMPLLERVQAIHPMLADEETPSQDIGEDLEQVEMGVDDTGRIMFDFKGFVRHWAITPGAAIDIAGKLVQLEREAARGIRSVRIGPRVVG